MCNSLHKKFSLFHRELQRYLSQLNEKNYTTYEKQNFNQKNSAKSIQNSSYATKYYHLLPTYNDYLLLPTRIMKKQSNLMSFSFNAHT